MSQENENAQPYRQASRPQLMEFCNDLVSATIFAKRKEVSATTVYNAIKNGDISPDDIFIICGRQYWRWSKYKDLVFRDYKK